GAGRRLADVREELGDGRQVRQVVGVLDQVGEGDESVCLAATVGQFKLADCLVALAGEADDHVTGELPQVVRGVSEGEELLRVAVDGAGAAHEHVVEVGGEQVHGQFARPQIVAKVDQLVPRLTGGLTHKGISLSVAQAARAAPVRSGQGSCSGN